jgi:hypothetical protein
VKYNRIYIILIAILFYSGCTKEIAKTPIFEVHYLQKKPHVSLNEFRVNVAENITLITISSNRGIGTGSIKLIEGNWTKKVIAHLHLGGLEGFAVSNGRVTFEKSDLLVKAYDKKDSLFDKEYLLAEKGYYEIDLPNSLFVDGVTEITIHWVDFYR